MSTLSKITVTEEAFYTFLNISVHFTGFAKDDLLATGMPETYYYTIMKESDQDNVRAFFNEAQTILDENGEDDKKLVKAIGLRLIPSLLFRGLAKKIILLWYTGIWTSTIIKKGSETEVSEMVSAESYQQGLIWVTAETHPAGAKEPGYNSWTKPPL